MPATQPDSLEFNPNRLKMTEIACYERLINANIERVWENVLDWEHLPHLHDTSFDYCDLDDAGEWGWRTWSDPDKQSHIELCVDKHQYVARSYRQGVQFSEIWTVLEAKGDATDIKVTFHATDVNPEKAASLGAVYLKLYEQLWSEDEAMMALRQQRLSATKSTELEVNLGHESALHLPVNIKLKGQQFELTSENGQLALSHTICPHLLGPLRNVGNGEFECPWHGYRFDGKTGECLSPSHATCKLSPLPAIVREQDNIIISFKR